MMRTNLLHLLMYLLHSNMKYSFPQSNHNETEVVRKRVCGCMLCITMVVFLMANASSAILWCALDFGLIFWQRPFFLFSPLFFPQPWGLLTKRKGSRKRLHDSFLEDATHLCCCTFYQPLMLLVTIVVIVSRTLWNIYHSLGMRNAMP